MATTQPSTALDDRYSEEGAQPTPWAEAQQVLEGAETFWLSTVRPDGRPHVTPLIAVWQDGAAYFCTGPEERKARNLAGNPACALTTGSNRLDRGLDVVLEGLARQVHDEPLLAVVASSYLEKYGAAWSFHVRDGALAHDEGGLALVFEVAPATAFGFRKGSFSQTRWRF